MALQIKKDKKREHPATLDVKAEIQRDEIVNLNFQLTAKKRQALKMKVTSEGRKITDVMNELIDEYLAK